MFKKWLSENNVRDYDFSGVIFEKASNREFWDPLVKKEYINCAEKYLGYEWPLMRATDYIAFATEGNRTRQETPHFNRRSALIKLFVGEVMEHKGRFIPDIVDGIFNICEETFWGLSAHVFHKGEFLKLPSIKDPDIDLFAAETGSIIAIILHILRDQLEDFCPEIVERMEDELEIRIINPFLEHNDFGWMNGRNNWNPWIHSNILTVFLLAKIEQDRFYAGIEKMISGINAIYEYYNFDGGCDEGVNYWAVSGGTIFEFLEQIYKATNGKINFYDDQKIKNIADYPYKAYIGDNFFVNYADGMPKGIPSWKSIFYCFGKRTGNENLSRLATEISREFDEKDLTAMRTTYLKRYLANIVYEDEIANQGAFTPCFEAVLPDLQNSFAREDKWFYSSNGGYNFGGHNHNDIGSFLAFYDNKGILVDPGCGVYTKQAFAEERYTIWTMRSDWHNTPTVNGKVQSYGKECLADYFSFQNKVTEISFAKAYESGANLEKLTRKISFKNGGIEIEDSFKFTAEENIIIENFVTPLEVEIKENTAVLGGKFKLSADCDIKITTDKQEFSGDEKLIKSWKTDRMNRVRFEIVSGTEKKIKIKLQSL